MRNDKKNIIVDKTLQFSLNIIAYAELLNSKNKFVLSNQILKSGTSIGANVREAQNAESKQDFIHKMKIAAKEADETEYWLTLCKMSDHYPDYEILLNDLNDIFRIIGKIISSSKTQAFSNF